MKNIFAISSSIIPILSLKEITPKLCVNCKFFISLEGRNEYGRCSLFKKTGMDINYLVSGKDDFLYCLTARSYDDMCGKEGKKYINKLDNIKDV
jgi:hypothetical protein